MPTYIASILPQCGGGGGGGGRRARVVERHRRWRRPTRAASTAAEETNIVDSAWRGLREFWDEKRNDTGCATIYRFETICNDS
jgi:hypothetical protein